MDETRRKAPRPPQPLYKSPADFINREHMDMSLDLNALSSLFELSRDAVIGAQDGVVRFVNPAARSLLGAEEGAPAERFLPADIVREPAARFTASGLFGGRSMAVSVTRQRIGDGDLSLYLVSRPQEAPGSPAAEAANAELGSLLMTQRLALDMLVDAAGAEADDTVSGYAAILYKTYYRAKRLHDHITSLALLDGEALRARRRLIALDELFEAVCGTTDTLAKEKGVSVRFEAAERCLILGDAQMLETLLFNLLANSLLHTEPGGAVRVSLARQGAKYVLAVDDPGAGIAPERLASLMGGSPEPDLTDPGAGAGLGLALVRRIAETHGGALFIESRPGEGTHMRVTLERPSAEELTTLREPPVYTPDSMDLALTELSVALDKRVYNQRMFD